MSEPRHDELEERSDPNYGTIAVVGILGVVITIAIIVGLQAFYYSEQTRQEEAKYALPPALLEYRAQQNTLLTSYGWVDRDAGIVAIPIDKAMDIVVRELEDS